MNLKRRKEICRQHFFRLGSDDEIYKERKIEVSPQTRGTGWQVSLYVYDKKKMMKFYRTAM